MKLPRLLYIVLMLLLAGCGFHLRGAVSLPEMMARTHVVAPNALALRAEIESLLRENGGEVTAQAEDATAILTLHGEQLRSRVLSVDAQGRAREYGLSLSVQYSLRPQGGEELVRQQNSRIERVLRVDAENVLAQGNEQELMEQEMRRTAAMHILRRLRSYTRAAEATPAAEAIPADEAIPAQ